MAQTIICLKRGHDRARFMRELRQAGLCFRPVKGLPRHFIIDGVAPDQLPASLKSDPAIEAIDDGEARGQVHDLQPISIDVHMKGANWAVPRTIRRRAPWNVARLVHPIETYFRSARDGEGVDCYIIDSGLRLSHEEFGGRATNVYEFFPSGGTGDDNGHGSSVASLACGAHGGTARAALLWSFKCIDSSGSGTNTALVSACGEALSHYNGRSGTNRPAVVNMSLGGFGSTVASAVQDIIAAGMVVVASAGNNMEDLAVATQYPAESDAAVIVVGGFGAADKPFYFGRAGTNWGERIDIMAPSERALAAGIDNDAHQRLFSGTSAGAGVTTGVVACMLQGHDRLPDRDHVLAVQATVRANGTAGRLRNPYDFVIEALPDRILYLDPNMEPPEPIDWPA
jgi:subtilisin family serine protease